MLALSEPTSTDFPGNFPGKTFTVRGNSMLPLYRHGDQLIVAIDIPVKTGDRVFVEIIDRAPLAGTLIHRDERDLILKAGGASRKSVILDIAEIKSIARVIWASQ